jgi:hypothetical protein
MKSVIYSNCKRRCNLIPPVDFATWQQTLAQHIRSPDANAPPPGVPPARAEIYARLFRNNIRRFINNAFPRTRAALDNSLWQQLQDGFMASHLCSSPYFHEIPAEFFQYLSQSDTSTSPPWLLSLLHYEWLEVALDTRPAPPADERPYPGDAFVLNPVSVLVAYDWQVHDTQTVEPPHQPCRLLLWRNQNHRVVCVVASDTLAWLYQQTDPDCAVQCAQLTQGTSPDIRDELEQLVREGLDRGLFFRAPEPDAS